MNKRVAYPIFIISFFILINVALRLVDYGLTNEGASQMTLSHIYNAFDIILVMYVPTILLVEQHDNSTVKKYFYVYLTYIIYSVGSNIAFLTGLLNSDGVLYSVPLYGLILIIIYIGYSEDRANHQYRIGRSIIASGIVHLVYVFVIPSNIERLYFTYAQLSLNPLTFIIIIMQMLVLDDLLIERQQKMDESRVVLKLED